jgi:hypothetical protein
VTSKWKGTCEDKRGISKENKTSCVKGGSVTSIPTAHPGFKRIVSLGTDGDAMVAQ